MYVTFLQLVPEFIFSSFYALQYKNTVWTPIYAKY